MSEIYKTAAIVGFYGDELDPDEITKHLECVPTIGVKKGDTWRTSLNTEKVAHTGSWRLKADRRVPGDLDRQINQLLDRATEDLTAWSVFASRFRAVVFCGLFLKNGNEGLSLRPETLLRIGARGLVLDLDIYSEADD